MAIEFVDSHTPYILDTWTTFGAYLSTNLPNLKTVFFTLIPRDPTRGDQFGYQWGQQTEHFLSSLGNLKATVILSLRWKEDCDYFEDKYAGIRGWRCISRRSEDQGKLTLGSFLMPSCWRCEKKKPRTELMGLQSIRYAVVTPRIDEFGLLWAGSQFEM